MTYCFNLSAVTHRQLSTLSKEVHEAAAAKARIDQLAAELWGLSRQELEDIQESLEDLG